MQIEKRLMDLQLFADGAAAGGEGGEGTAVEAGENTGAAAAEQRLRELGVPEDRIRKRAKKAEADASIVVRRDTDAPEQPQTPAAEEQKEETPKKMSWADIMKDPEYNAEMQRTIQQRLRGSKETEAKLTKLQGVIDTLKDFYGVTSDDIDELVSKVTSDDRFYQEEAERLDTSPEVARRLRQADRQKEAMERQAAAEKAREAESEKQRQIQGHFQGLQDQAAKLVDLLNSLRTEEEGPITDANAFLENELKDPRFLRMTAPGSGLSVEDVYFSIHRKEMMERGYTQATINAKRAIARAVQANASRPVENGVGSVSSSLSQIDYSAMSAKQRQQLREEIRRAAGRGEKLYPSDIFRR